MNDSRSIAPGVRGRVPMALAAAALVACGGGGGGGGGGGTPEQAPFNIVAAGDIGHCDGAPAATTRAAATAALVRPDDLVVLTLGDSTYPVGAPAEFRDCFDPTWGAFKDRIRPTVGNHEYLTPGAEGYYAYFGAAAGPERRGYYSFDVRGWHFISLNSNVDASPGSAQAQWLAADLASSARSRCTLAYWHYPVFSSGLHGNIAQMARTFETLQAAGVDVVLVGHDHHYERFAPQTAAAQPDPARGIRAFVVGTGGAELYPLVTVRANSEFRDNSRHGVLRMTLSADRYSWQFVPADGGAPRDAGSAACHD
ncbi:MAG: metallophosphoesterase [Rubrivivax sp.]